MVQRKTEEDNLTFMLLSYSVTDRKKKRSWVVNVLAKSNDVYLKTT